MNIYFKIEHREYQAKKLHIDRQENYKTSEYTFFLKTWLRNVLPWVSEGTWISIFFHQGYSFSNFDEMLLKS